MRLTLVLTILLLNGCATGHTSTDPLSFDDRPIAKACLTDPPPTTDIFWTNFCEGLLGIDERERAHRQEWARLGALKAPQSLPATRERTIITPVPSRHAPPQCNAACQARYRQALRDAQMDDATFEAELRAANRNPFQREPLSCTSYQLGMFTQTDCY